MVFTLYEVFAAWRAVRWPSTIYRPRQSIIDRVAQVAGDQNLSQFLQVRPADRVDRLPSVSISIEIEKVFTLDEVFAAWRAVRRLSTIYRPRQSIVDRVAQVAGDQCLPHVLQVRPAHRVDRLPIVAINEILFHP